MAKKRVCLFGGCKNELTGRSDQKFCSSNCRNFYHNSNPKERGGGYDKG